ncbi:hypothetical protein [Lysobacter capsici]|uniref:hypothetical protein n=1 Tax=Lysobacter capsici TaxID=435897 RepID=UPI0011DF517F|nr:hypothetical protein [Lysobacter capsici]
MMRYTENRNFNTRVGRFGIGLIGTVAGSVIAPVTTGSAAKAWSGVSGASNALQSQMDSVFSSSNHIRRRAAIAQAAREAKREFLDERSAGKKRDIAIAMATACETAAADADQQALEALSNAPIRQETDAEKLERLKAEVRLRNLAEQEVKAEPPPPTDSPTGPGKKQL